VAGLQSESLSEAKRRILWRLKRTEQTTAAVLADEFGLTDTAVRQHLDALEGLGLVERRNDRPNGRGRPPVLWSVTPAADAFFPDRHDDLLVGLMDAVHSTYGPETLSALFAQLGAYQRATYEAAMAADGEQSLAARLNDFARLRAADGFLTEILPDPTDVDGTDSFVLTEHHCPVMTAARHCGAVCESDLEMIRGLMGPGTQVTAIGTLATGDARCTYRVSRAS